MIVNNKYKIKSLHIRNLKYRKFGNMENNYTFYKK